MANHRHDGLERRPRGNGRYAAADVRPMGPLRRRRDASLSYLQPPADAICEDCGGTGLRAASLDPYCGCALTCRSCAGTSGHQDRTIFLMQMAFGCGIGLATLAVALL